MCPRRGNSEGKLVVVAYTCYTKMVHEGTVAYTCYTVAYTCYTKMVHESTLAYVHLLHKDA